MSRNRRGKKMGAVMPSIKIRRKNKSESVKGSRRNNSLKSYTFPSNNNRI